MTLLFIVVCFYSSNLVGIGLIAVGIFENVQSLLNGKASPVTGKLVILLFSNLCRRHLS